MKALLLFFALISALSLPAQIIPPYVQDFEGPFPPTGWQTFPIGSPVNWVRDTTASGYGNSQACISFDNFNTSAGSYYGVRLPSMNFSGVTQPYLQFDYAYALRTGTASDIFGIWWSNNGTSNWQNLINYSNASLVTAPATSAMFLPAPSDWRTKTLSLSSLAGLSFVRLAIEDDCNNGNKIYIDNVRVFDSTLVGIESPSNQTSSMLLCSDRCSLEIPFNGIVSCTVYDLSGRILLRHQETGYEKQWRLSTEDFSPGIYLVNMFCEGQSYSRKIAVMR